MQCRGSTYTKHYVLFIQVISYLLSEIHIELNWAFSPNPNSILLVSFLCLVFKQ